MWTRSGLWQPGVDALLGKPSARAPCRSYLPLAERFEDSLADAGCDVHAFDPTWELVASSTATPRGEPPGRGVEVVATPYLD